MFDSKVLQDVVPFYRNNPKVLEMFHTSPGLSGNPQRNRAIQLINDGMLYFLDDDNIMNPNFWSWLPEIRTGHVYTFDQLRGIEPLLLKDDAPKPNCIDTAQYLIDRELIGNTTWQVDDYGADGPFISSIVKNHKSKHLYIPKVLAFHNFIKSREAGHSWTRLDTWNQSVARGLYANCT